MLSEIENSSQHIYTSSIISLNMGIKVEYCPGLALRNISEFHKGNKKIEECIPEKMVVGKIYSFLKKDLRLYWLDGEKPLFETKGGEALSKPKASIMIIEVTHFLDNNEAWTKGKYSIVEIFNDHKIHFECFDKVGLLK